LSHIKVCYSGHGQFADEMIWPPYHSPDADHAQDVPLADLAEWTTKEVAELQAYRPAWTATTGVRA
jgi:hypothetical protein